MTNDQTLKEAIEAWIQQYKHNEKFFEGKVISLWEPIVGPMIAKETDHIFVKNKVMIVKLRSAALKFELEFAKKKLVKSINKQAGREVITDISFI